MVRSLVIAAGDGGVSLSPWTFECSPLTRRVASLTHRVRYAYNPRMLRPYHVKIMHLALGDTFSSRALDAMIQANIHQDRLLGLIGHPEFHFDDNAFEKSHAYIEEQRALTVSALMNNDAPAAWSASGRLTHTAQDFYAHSNYIDLWLSCQSDGAIPTPSEVNPLDPDLIDTPALRSGKVYILEGLTLIPPLRPLVMPFLPRDSHAWMNLDSPARGPGFPYAFQAAVERTRIEFERTIDSLPRDLKTLFVDRGTGTEKYPGEHETVSG